MSENKIAEDKIIVRTDGVKFIWGIVLRFFLSHMLFELYQCMENLPEKIICGLAIVWIMAALFITVLPIKIMLEEDGIVYRRFLFQKKKYLYKWMYSYKNINYNFNFIIPLFSRYSILIEDDNGNKETIHCGSLSKKDFNVVLEAFMEIGHKEHRKEKAEHEMVTESSNNILFQETIYVPKDKIVKKSTFLLKCIMCGIALLIAIDGIRGICQMEGEVKIDLDGFVLADFVVGFILWGLMLLMLYAYPVICWLRIAKENRKIPEKILLYDDFIQIDDKIYYVDKMTKVCIVPEQYIGKRTIMFQYEGERKEYYFGKKKKREKEYFEKYKKIVEYCFDKGFSTAIYTK